MGPAACHAHPFGMRRDLGLSGGMFDFCGFWGLKPALFPESHYDFPVPRPARGIDPRQRRCAPWGLSAWSYYSLFESLQSRLTGVFDRLRGRGSLTEADVDAALGEVRTALIEADV